LTDGFPFNLETAHGMAVTTTIIMVKELLEAEALVSPELPDGVNASVVDVMTATMEKDLAKRQPFDRIVQFGYFAPGRERDARLCEDEEVLGEDEGEGEGDAAQCRAETPGIACRDPGPAARASDCRGVKRIL
jgi:hypothetical protein